jgi:hypothetical protein
LWVLENDRGGYVRRSRGILAFVLLLAVAMASTGAVVWFKILRLPDPETASSRDLLRWVATQDLSRYSLATRRTLARRLEQTFAGQGGSIGGDAQESSGMSPQMCVLMLKNLELLVEPWVLEKTEGYTALPASERMAYVDRVLDTFDLWQDAAGWVGSEAALDVSMPQHRSPVLMFLNKVEQCRERAEPRLRGEIDRFLLAVQTRWVSRKLSAVFN